VIYSCLLMVYQLYNIERAVERLDKLYRCKTCSACFLFTSDMEDHDLFLSHTGFEVVPLE
jgi:hypothetical protein